MAYPHEQGLLRSFKMETMYFGIMCICLCALTIPHSISVLKHKQDGSAVGTPLCPCDCKETSRGVFAHCSNQGLTSVCNNCGNNVTRMDFSRNELTSLEGQFYSLQTLVHLDVSHNKITSVKFHDVNVLPHLTFFNLSHNHITHIHVKDFLLPQLKVLDVGYNQITDVNFDITHIPGLEGTTLVSMDSLSTTGNAINAVEEYAYSPVKNLRRLHLNGNKLQGLQPHAFSGLGNLLFLNLSGNSLFMNATSYPHGVLDPLVRLQVLSMYSNIFTDCPLPVNNTFPFIFSHLQHLRVLEIDTCKRPQFGEPFRNLTRLIRLDLSNQCYTEALTNTSFSGFRNGSLQELIVNACPVSQIASYAFAFLPNLKLLSMKNIQLLLTLRIAFTALAGLQNQTMSLIDMTDVNSKPALSVGVRTRNDTQYIASICVSTWIFRENNLGFVVASGPWLQPNTTLSRCLERFDISRNTLLSAYVFLRRAVGMFKYFDQLVHLSAECQTRHYSASCLKPSQLSVSRDMFTTRRQRYRSQQRCAWGVQRTNTNEQPSSSTRHFVLPRNLKFLNLSYTDDLMDCFQHHVYFGGNLTVLDLSYNSLQNLSGSMTGLDWLQELHLGGDITTASESLLASLKRLQQLHLPETKVTSFWLETRGCSVLGNLISLRLLDFSHNVLEMIPPAPLTCLPELKELDLRDNHMATLSVDFRDTVDTLSLSRGFTLRLSGNRVSCMCDNLDFVLWLAITQVHLDHDGDYPCLNEHGATTTGQIQAHFDFHWRQCVGLQLLLVSAVLMATLLIGLVLVLLASRNITYLRYLLNTMRNVRMPKREDFRKDAYVGYADVDWELACVTVPQCLQDRRGVRLLLRHQEEIPGSVRAENVIQHIDDSWKVGRPGGTG